MELREQLIDFYESLLSDLEMCTIKGFSFSLSALAEDDLSAPRAKRDAKRLADLNQEIDLFIKNIGIVQDEYHRQYMAIVKPFGLHAVKAEEWKNQEIKALVTRIIHTLDDDIYPYARRFMKKDFFDKVDHIKQSLVRDILNLKIRDFLMPKRE